MANFNEPKMKFTKKKKKKKEFTQIEILTRQEIVCSRDLYTPKRKENKLLYVLNLIALMRVLNVGILSDQNRISSLFHTQPN